MPANDRQFKAELAKFETTIDEDLVKLHRLVSLDLLRRLVLKTPVDTGRARGNWQTAIGAAVEGDIERLDPGGGAAIQEGLSKLAGLKPFETVWISNNLDYIEILEAGHSDQAPAGFFAISVAELGGLLEAA